MTQAAYKVEQLSAFSRRVLQHHMVRKTARQKEDFRTELVQTLKQAGWPVQVENSGKLLRSNNVVAGNLATAGVVCTAHYDTPAGLPFPNFLAPRNLFVTVLYQILLALFICAIPFLLPVALQFVLARLWPGAALPGLAITALELALLGLMMFLLLAGPANKNNANDNTSGVLTLIEAALALPETERGKVALVFFDNEELGLVGSSAFRAKHGRLPGKPLLNFDCVGDGDTLLFVQPRACRSNKELQQALARAFVPPQGKQVLLDKSSFTFYPSDQIGFAMGIGVAAFCTARGAGLYVSRIHTRKDTRLDQQNILMLRQGILRMAASL